MNKILHALGLKDEEIKAFETLLKYPGQPISFIAKKAGIPRVSMYGYINNLFNTGVVSESMKNGVKIFYPCNDAHIITIFNSKIKELSEIKETISPTFLAIKKENFEKLPQYEYFDGVDGLKKILFDIVLYKNITTYAYWPINSIVNNLGKEFFEIHNTERIKNNISVHAIWPEHGTVSAETFPYLAGSKETQRELRIAPPGVDFMMGYWIYGNKVVFISSKEECFGFVIESKEFSEMMLSQFNIIWDMSHK